jgi:hypothetical protein
MQTYFICSIRLIILENYETYCFRPVPNHRILTRSGFKASDHVQEQGAPGLKAESATHSGGCVFQSAGQRSCRTLDGVLKPLLN